MTEQQQSDTREKPRALLYELEKDLVEMTDEEIDAFAAEVAADAREALRPSYERSRKKK